MRIRKSPATLLAVLLLAAGVASVGFWGYRRIRAPSFDAWLADVTRPGYELRYRSRTATHYVALFEVDANRLAVCRRAIDGGQTRPDVEAKVTDVWGNDVAVQDQPRQKLTRQWDFGVARYAVDDGELIAIRPEFRGRMRIVLDTDSGDADPYRLGVLDVHIRWGDDGTNEFLLRKG